MSKSILVIDRQRIAIPVARVLMLSLGNFAMQRAKKRNIEITR